MKWNLKSIGIYLIIMNLLVSCNYLEKPPEKIYEEFRKACENADLATAERLVTQAGIADSREFGVCPSLLPDGMNQMAGFDVFILEDPLPIVEITGDTAYLSWTTIAGHNIAMTMYRDDGWKIRETLILYDN